MHSFSLGTLLLKLQLSEDRPFSLGLCRQVENLQDQALQRSLLWAGTCRRRRPSLPGSVGTGPAISLTCLAQEGPHCPAVVSGRGEGVL